MSKRKRAMKMIGKVIKLGVIGDVRLTGLTEGKENKGRSSWDIWGGRRDGKTSLCYTAEPVGELPDHLRNPLFGYRKKTGDFLVRVVDRIYYENSVFGDYPE